MNRPPLDELLQRCESEPLHRSGAVQPFGALVHLDAPGGRVTHASRNLVALTGTEVEAVLGRTFDELGWAPAGAVERVPPTAGKRVLVPLRVASGDLDVVATMVRGERSVLVELERRDADLDDAAWRSLLRALHAAPPRFEDVPDHHRRLVAAIAAISGFDRVMVYRFHDDWTGEVIAECASPGLGSYLGLRFPASDIPAIARNLYLVNPSRLIPDVAAAPSPIVGATPEPPDLTYSTLRSVSTVHLEYLGNMGVKASFSVPIRIGGRLWGLVACHHLAPRVLSPERRDVAVRAVDAYSAGVVTAVASRRLQMVDSLQRRLAALCDGPPGDRGSIERLGPRLGELRALLDADALVALVGDERAALGDVPSDDALAALDAWFLARSVEPVFASSHLEAELPAADALLAAASGVLAVKWRARGKRWGRCYWLRRQQIEEVTWAGNPDKPVVEDAGAWRLSPRRSFEAWVERKMGYARPWSSEERMTAAHFRNLMAEAAP